MKALFVLLVALVAVQGAHLRAQVADDELIMGLDQVTNILSTVIPDVTNFMNAMKLWKNVDWKTGKGLNEAIMSCAKTSTTLYKDVNKASGGKLNDAVLNSAVVVAATALPPVGAAISAGKFIYNIKNNTVDLTDMIVAIRKGVEANDYVTVATNSYKLFTTVSKFMV